MTDARPNSMRKLDNAIKKMAADEKAYVNVRSLIANAIVAQMIPDGVVKGGTSLKLRFGDATTRYTTNLDTALARGANQMYLLQKMQQIITRHQLRCFDLLGFESKATR